MVENCYIAITLIVVLLIIYIIYTKSKSEGYSADDAVKDSEQVLSGLNNVQDLTTTLASALSDATQQKLDETNKIIEDLNTQLKITKETLDSTYKILEAANKKIAALDKEIVSKGIELNSAKAAFVDAQSRIQMLSSNVSASTRELEKAQAEVDDAKRKLAEKSEVLKAIEKEKAVAEANAAKANAEADALNAKLTEIEIAKIEANREAARLKAEKDRRDAEDAATEAKLASLDYLKGYSVEPGYSVSGPTLANYVNMSTNQCARKCDNTVGCIGATYDANTKACFIRGNLDDVRMGFEYENLMIKGGKAPESSTYSVIKPKVEASKQANKFYSTTLAAQAVEAQKRGVSLANMDYLSNYNVDHGLKSKNPVLSEYYDVPSTNACARLCDLTLGCNVANYNLDSKACSLTTGMDDAEGSTNAATTISSQKYEIPIKSSYHIIKPNADSEANVKSYYQSQLAKQLEMAAAQGIDVNNLNFEGKYEIFPEFKAPTDGNISSFYGITDKNACARKCDLALGCVGAYYSNSNKECHLKSKFGAMSRGSKDSDFLLKNPDYEVPAGSDFNTIKSKIEYERNSAAWRKKVTDDQNKRAATEGRNINSLDYLTPYNVETRYTQINWADGSNLAADGFPSANLCARECDLTYGCKAAVYNGYDDGNWGSCYLYNEMPQLKTYVDPSALNNKDKDPYKIMYKGEIARNNNYWNIKPTVELTKVIDKYTDDKTREFDDKAKAMGITANDLNYLENYTKYDDVYNYMPGSSPIMKRGLSENQCAKLCETTYNCKGVNYDTTDGTCYIADTLKTGLAASDTKKFYMRNNVQFPDSTANVNKESLAYAKKYYTDPRNAIRAEQMKKVQAAADAKGVPLSEYSALNNYNIIENRTFHGGIDPYVGNIFGLDKKACALECDLRPKCKGIIYNSANQSCQLGGDPANGLRDATSNYTAMYRKTDEVKYTPYFTS